MYKQLFVEGKVAKVEYRMVKNIVPNKDGK